MILRQLNAIETQFRRVLDPSGLRSLQEARAELVSTYERYRREARRPNPPPWGYDIPPARPLLFKPVSVRGTRYQVDIICAARWLHPDAPTVHQALALRVWGLDMPMIFRHDMDSEAIGELIQAAEKRVMLRYHFDTANPGQAGPRYHLQAGGRAFDDELCWLHEEVSIPRIAHHPMDLTLACELVAANFLGESGSRILRDATVMGAVRASQENLVRPYLEDCLGSVERGESLLMSQWIA